MELIYPLNLIPFLKDKYLLLDTNIFRESSPMEYINTLKTIL